MKYYALRPEVAGGIGPRSVLDYTSTPPKVVTLNYEFEGWLGDELLKAFSCFIATDRVCESIKEHGFTGVEFGPVDVTTSDTFRELYPTVALPHFVWLKICGKPGGDDFGVAPRNRLVVSERVLSALELKHCDVVEFVSE